MLAGLLYCQQLWFWGRFSMQNGLQRRRLCCCSCLQPCCGELLHSVWWANSVVGQALNSWPVMHVCMLALQPTLCMSPSGDGALLTP
jgi:hypothetical protein